MANWLVRMLSGSRLKVSSAAEDGAYVESVRKAFDSTESDISYQRQMAIALESIRDDGIDRVLAEKMLNPSRVVATDANGDFVYVTDAQGNFKLDAEGNRIPKMVEYTAVNDFYAAMYNMLSPVNRLSHINGSDARILYWQMEDIVSDILMSSPRSRLDSGEIAYVKSLLADFHILLQDANGGKKLLALLTMRQERTASVSLGPNESNGKKVF